ncbi:hypothetical protein CRUP_014433 [Coryphaenoides rupestris]|nr:hypothetical protein CRUP_014433 [Coryphaenoides rupestris]
MSGIIMDSLYVWFLKVLDLSKSHQSYGGGGGGGGGETAEISFPKMVAHCCRFLCYFCRISRRNQGALFDRLSYLLENSSVGLEQPLRPVFLPLGALSRSSSSHLRPVVGHPGEPVSASPAARTYAPGLSEYTARWLRGFLEARVGRLFEPRSAALQLAPPRRLIAEPVLLVGHNVGAVPRANLFVEERKRGLRKPKFYLGLLTNVAPTTRRRFSLCCGDNNR